jgi:hypothetical protein
LRVILFESVIGCHHRERFAAFPSLSAITSTLIVGWGRGTCVTASNDNRRARKKRSRAKAPRSLATMTRVLADIYATPPKPMIDRPDESLAWLGDERHVPAVDRRGHDAFPASGAKR